MRDKKGFTLIEMVVVIVILAIIASFAIPAIMRSIKEYQNEKYIVDARKVYTDAQLYVIKKKVYYEVNKSTDIVEYYDCSLGKKEKASFNMAVAKMYNCEESISSYENRGIEATIDNEFKVETFKLRYNGKEVSFDKQGTPTVTD